MSEPRCPRCGCTRSVGWAQAPWAPVRRQCVPCGTVYGPAQPRKANA